MDRRELTEVRVILEPVMQMLQRLSLFKLICATNSKTKQGIEVKWVNFISSLERDNRIVILIIFLV